MRVDQTYLDLISSAASPFHFGNISFSVPPRSFERTAATLLDYCADCKRGRMAAVPQGMFAANKVRANMERTKTWQQNRAIEEPEFGFEPKQQARPTTLINESALETPMKYNSKLMNSIWGLYNRYSVHNFKKNTDGKLFEVGEHQLNAAVSQTTFFAGQNN